MKKYNIIFLIIVLALNLQYGYCNHKSINIESNGGAAINLQDQTTRALDLRLNEFLDTTITLGEDAILNSYSVTMSAGHNIITGDSITILEQNQNNEAQIYFGKTISVNGNIITLDTPIPYGFSKENASIAKYSININIDGSTTTKIFSLTNIFERPADITRIIFHITDDVSMDDAKFGGITALSRGVVLRKKNNDGTYTNYWNAKNNGEFGELAYDKTYDPKAPAGVYGLTVRMTYAGQEKHGVVIRLAKNEAIELLIQDDLTDLDSFTAMVQGHFTQD